MKAILKLPLFILLFTAIIAFPQEGSINFKSAVNPITGFSAHDPIVINAPTKREIRKKAEYFFRGLRNEKGERLQVIEILEIPNPNYTNPRIKLHNYITGEVINKGNGKFLKKVILKAEERGDIYELYVNTDVKANLQIPLTFIFEAPHSPITSN